MHETIPVLPSRTAKEEEESEGEGGEICVGIDVSPKGEGGEEVHPTDGVDVVDDEEEHAWVC